jgi:hypothetical protein
MTLETCKRLLEHYEAVGNEEGAKEMRDKLALRGEPVSKFKSKKKE